MITVTFIRHGESEDNPLGIWAGWKDAPLSELGRRQAKAVAAFFSSTKLDIVYASPLARAHATGKAVHDAQPDPKGPFVVNPNLREQHFGIAEGHKWSLHRMPGMTLEDMYAEGIYPVLTDLDGKFPHGESLNDLARRADEAIQECVIPHLMKDGFHVAAASHGLCIGEMTSALIRLDPEADRTVSYKGLENTAWTRVQISLPNGYTGEVDPHNLPPLSVKVTEFNKYDHLFDIEGAPALDQSNAAAEDEQRAIEAKAFFGGANVDKSDMI